MFFGSIPPLVTPFSGNCVDEDSLRGLIEWQIDEGSSGLVPCGTTGEAATLKNDILYAKKVGFNFLRLHIKIE